MRTFAALTLYVLLVHSGKADAIGSDWNLSSREAFEAVSREDYPRAEMLFRESLSLAQTAHQSAIAAGNIGVVLHRSGRNDEARAWLEHAIENWKDPMLGAQLALLHRFGGDYLRAEQVARASLIDVRAGANPAARTTLLNTLGDTLREEVRNPEARGFFEESLAVRDAPWRNRMEAMAGIAAIDSDTAKWQEAVELARSHHDRLYEGIAVRGLGETWMTLNRPERAEPLLRQALTMFEESKEASDSQKASTLSALGELYIGGDKAAMAEDVLLRALAIDEKALGAAHPQGAMVLQMLGDAAARLGRIDETRRYFDRASMIMCARFGEQSAVEGAVLVNLGTIEQRSGYPAAAAAAYRKALPILEAHEADHEALRISVTQRYALALKATHHDREAKVLLAQVKSFRKN